jgi:hypothetical protein
MDKGLWITWYNLLEEGRKDHLDWLHGDYIPKRLEDSRFLYAAHYASESNVTLSGEKGRLKNTTDLTVPTGDRYILIFGATDAHVFFNPDPDVIHRSGSIRDKSMLAMRLGERVSIMTEVTRSIGPAIEARHSEYALAPCIQIGSFNAMDSLHEYELSAWYAKWRLPRLSKLEGTIAVRKLVSIAGWAKHVILYEFTSVHVRNKEFIDHEGSNPIMEKWTDDVVRKLNHAPGSPNLAERIWPTLS